MPTPYAHCITSLYSLYRKRGKIFKVMVEYSGRIAMQDITRSSIDHYPAVDYKGLSYGIGGVFDEEGRRPGHLFRRRETAHGDAGYDLSTLLA